MVEEFKMIGILLNVVHREVKKKTNIQQRDLIGFITIPLYWTWIVDTY